MVDSNFGKWDYSGVDHVCYSDPACESYKKAIAFLDDGTPIEDWGGGTGWAGKYVKNSTYRNVDGNAHHRVDEVADLAKYTSKGHNILIRQVLECVGDDWLKVLRNAVRSFENKLCIVIGTPQVETTQVGELNPEVKSDGTVVEGSFIKEYYFARQDLIDNFSGFNITEETVNTEQYYHQDWIIYVTRLG